MSWYGKSSTKELDSIIEKKPKLTQLLLYSDFLTELKAYNTKLLDYLSNNPALFRQAIEYLTLPPNPSDSHQRKFKLPLVVVQMVETQTTCVLNTFFKQTGNGDQIYFDLLFSGLQSGEVLPLLMGYIFRVCFCLINNRQKEVIDRMYRNSSFFMKLLEHSYHMAASNIAQLFLNLDINKHQNIGTSQEKLKIKLEVLNKIVSKIQMESMNKKQRSCNILQNLCLILCQTIEKYYLIIDGKQLMDIITSEKTILAVMSLIRSPNSDYAFPGFNFCISLINYYSFSSFNVDDVTTEAGKKVLEKLQSQALIIELVKYFPSALDRVTRSASISLYLYQLLEVLCHCISISSLKILQCIRKTKFFSCLVKLLLTHEQNNILHKLIEKSFLHIFISDRKIYNEYKRHLFCELDIIDCTAGNLIRMYPDETTILQQAKKKHFFGHFMRILKIYSGIETKDEQIVAAIRSKSELWNKISKNLILPYESMCEKKLGTYEDVPQPVFQDFKISKNSEFNQKTSFIKPQQDSKNQALPLNATMPKSEQQKNSSSQKKITDLFAVPTVTSHVQNTGNEAQISPIVNNNIKIRQNNHMSHSSVIDYRTDDKDKQLKKSESFKEFMNKKKVEAEQQIKLKRSLSQQKRLSGSKMSSPSPSKKNSWKQQHTEDKGASEKKKLIPKIPLNRKSLAQSSVVEKKNRDDSIEDKKSVKSMVNMDELRKIRVYQIEKPAQKKYRHIEEKDKILLDFLGLQI